MSGRLGIGFTAWHTTGMSGRLGIGFTARHTTGMSGRLGVGFTARHTSGMSGRLGIGFTARHTSGMSGGLGVGFTTHAFRWHSRHTGWHTAFLLVARHHHHGRHTPRGVAVGDDLARLSQLLGGDLGCAAD